MTSYAIIDRRTNAIYSILAETTEMAAAERFRVDGQRAPLGAHAALVVVESDRAPSVGAAVTVDDDGVATLVTA